MIVKDTERAERSERSRAERDGGGAAGENARSVTTKPGSGSSIKSINTERIRKYENKNRKNLPDERGNSGIF